MDHYKQLEIQELIDALSFKCKIFIKNDTFFFKGVVSDTILDKFYEVDPSLFVRKSKTIKEHGNAYNLLFNNLQSWAALPKRQNSVIMSNSIVTAKAFSNPNSSKGEVFGKTYCVMPEIDSILVIAPERDIWNSFRNGLSKIGLRGANGNLIHFNRILNRLYESTQNNTEFDKDWSTFKVNLEMIAEGILEPKDILSDEEKRFLDYLKKNKGNLIGFFDNIFNPVYNGIVTVRFSEDFKKNNFNNNEIWTESKCLLFEDITLAEIKKYIIYST